MTQFSGETLHHFSEVEVGLVMPSIIFHGVSLLLVDPLKSTTVLLSTTFVTLL